MQKNIICKYDDFCVFEKDGQLFFENFDYEEGNPERITPIEIVRVVEYVEYANLTDDQLLDMCDCYDVSYEEDETCNYVFAKYIEEEDEL